MNMANTTLADRIKDFRNSCPGIATQQGFAEALGIDQQRLSGYEHGTRVPSHVLAAMVTLGANPYWLLFGEGPMRKPNASEQVRDMGVKAISSGSGDYGDAMAEFYVLPLYSNEAVLAKPPQERDAEIEGPAVVHRAWCSHPENTECVRVSLTGNSMEPAIPLGSIVTIDRNYTDPDRLVGKTVVMAKYEGGVSLKRLHRCERGGFIGVPDNPAPENLPMPLEEGDSILGVVTTILAKLF